MGLFDFLKPNKNKGADPFKTSNGSVAQLASVLLQSIAGSDKAGACACFRNGVIANSRFLSLIEPTPFKDGLKLKGGNGKPLRSGEAYLLQVRPNPLMNATQFWRRVAQDYFFGAAAVYIERGIDGITPAAFWPIDMDPSCVDIKAAQNGHLWFRFRLNGKNLDVRDDDVLILTYEPLRELLSRENKSLEPYFKALGTSVQGLEAAIKVSMALRFIILGGNTTGWREAGSASEEMSKLLNGDNTAVNLSDGNNVIQVQNQGKWPLAPEIATVEDKIYQYLGVTPAIMKGDFTEAQWASYYARTIAPTIAELEDELNAKILTKEEYFKGNEWRIGVDRLEVITPNTALKRAELKKTFPVVVTNSLLQDLGEDPIEGGDQPMYNLAFSTKPSDGTQPIAGNGGEGRPSGENEKAGENPEEGDKTPQGEE